MAALTTTTLQGGGSRAVTENTLGSSDTFTIENGKRAFMILFNPTGGTITPTLSSGLANFNIPDAMISVNASTNFTVAVLAGEWRLINLTESYRLVDGTVTITSGTSLKCFIFKE